MQTVRRKWFIHHGLFHTYRHSKSHKHHNPCAFSSEMIFIDPPTPYDDFYFQSVWFCVQNLTDNILNDKLSGTEIFHFLLTISSTTTTAVPARLSKVCNATSKAYYIIFTFTWCCVSTKYSIQYFDKLLTVLGNSSPSPNIEENTTTVVPVWLLKCTTTHSQNIVSSLFIQLILYTSYYWVTYLIPNPHPLQIHRKPLVHLLENICGPSLYSYCNSLENEGVAPISW